MAFGDPPAPPTHSGGHSSAKGLLTQIKGLLNQYEALDEATPLKAEAKSFEHQVDAALDHLNSGGDTPPESSGDHPGESKPDNFRDATKAAASKFGAAMAASKASGGTKTDEDEDDSSEQSPDDDPFKKRSKAGAY